MKLTDQNVPPELQTQYAQIVSTNAAGVGNQKKARTRKKVRKTKPRKENQREILQLKRAAYYIAALRVARGEPVGLEQAMNEVFAQIKMGVFSPEWWVECEQYRTETFEAFPTSTPRDFIASYLYPDPSNKPTVPVYPDGTPSIGTPAYVGLTTGDRFADTSLKWHRLKFNLNDTYRKGQYKPLFIQLSGSIDILATDRSCRAFRAVTFKHWIVTGASARLNTLEAPVKKSRTVWPHAKAEPAAPPFYHAVQQVTHSQLVNASDHYTEVGDCTQAVVLVANRALMGKWYNNNRSATTTLTYQCKLYRPELPFLFPLTGLPFADEPVDICSNGQMLYLRTLSGAIWLSASGSEWLYAGTVGGYLGYGSASASATGFITSGLGGNIYYTDAQARTTTISSGTPLDHSTGLPSRTIARGGLPRTIWVTEYGRSWADSGIQPAWNSPVPIGAGDCFVGSDFNENLQYSLDGLNWSVGGLIPYGFRPYKAVNHNGIYFIALVNEDQVWFCRTADFINLTRITGIPQFWPFDFWTNGSYIYTMGLYGRIRRSTQGITWTNIETWDNWDVLASTTLESRSYLLTSNGTIMCHWRQG